MTRCEWVEVTQGRLNSGFLWTWRWTSGFHRIRKILSQL